MEVISIPSIGESRVVITLGKGDKKTGEMVSISRLRSPSTKEDFVEMISWSGLIPLSGFSSIERSMMSTRSS